MRGGERGYTLYSFSKSTRYSVQYVLNVVSLSKTENGEWREGESTEGGRGMRKGWLRRGGGGRRESPRENGVLCYDVL